MSWVSSIGLALDAVGALLLATFLRRTSDEAHDAAGLFPRPTGGDGAVRIGQEWNRSKVAAVFLATSLQNYWSGGFRSASCAAKGDVQGELGERHRRDGRTAAAPTCRSRFGP